MDSLAGKQVYRGAGGGYYLDQATAVRLTSSRPPRIDELFLRPSGRKNTWIIESAQNNFASRCFLIVGGTSRVRRNKQSLRPPWL